MNNFNSIFEELSKLYEEEEKNVTSAKQEVKDEKDSDIATSSATQGPSDALQTKGLGNNTLKEATDDEEIEIVDDETAVAEMPAEEPVEEPRQLILECDKCGALVIKDEADIVVDEETDLVNSEDECQFCEEAKGYKIIGVVAPYDVADEGIVEEPVPAEDAPVEDIPTEEV